jgi:hypothetical protein
MCGHLCGFDITATTATPLAVLTGFARNCGNKLFLCSSGTAEIISVSRTVPSTPYFFAALFFALFKFNVWFDFTASIICSMTSFTVRNRASSCVYAIRLCFPLEEVTTAPTFLFAFASDAGSRLLFFSSSSSFAEAARGRDAGGESISSSSSFFLPQTSDERRFARRALFATAVLGK